MLKINKELQTKLFIFKNDKRAYASFLILTFFFLITLPAEFICNVRPLIIVLEGKPYFPIPFTYSEEDFGGVLPSEPDYKSVRFMNILKGISDTPIQIVDKSNSFDLQLDDFENEDTEDKQTFIIELDDFEESDESITSTIDSSSIKNIFWPSGSSFRLSKSETSRNLRSRVSR